MLKFLGMTKEQWIEKSLRREERHFQRCENCQHWKCQAIINLEAEYPLFVKTWYEYGTNCEMFLAKEGATK